VYFVFVKIDGLLHIPIPGIGFIATIVFITFIGLLASSILTKGLVKMLDNLFNKIPFIKLVYSSLKDLMKAFVGEKKMFDRPVLVSLSCSAKVIGFITSDDLEWLDIKDSVAVYMPQAYNFAGNLIIVPKNQVTPIDKDGGEVMAFIVSAGLSPVRDK
ncbi:MAG: DUF502 domain-containing protein, partial [Planctomycetota bacterium]